MEIRGDHVIAVSDADGIGVGIVGQEDGIPVIAILRVAPGGFGPGISGKPFQLEDQARIGHIAFRRGRKAHFGDHGAGNRQLVSLHLHPAGDVHRFMGRQVLRQHPHFPQCIGIAEGQAPISAENAHGRRQVRDFDLHRDLLQDIFAAQRTAHRSDGHRSAGIAAGQDERTRRVLGPHLRKRHVPAHPCRCGHPYRIAVLMPDPTLVRPVFPAVLQD